MSTLSVNPATPTTGTLRGKRPRITPARYLYCASSSPQPSVIAPITSAMNTPVNHRETVELSPLSALAPAPTQTESKPKSSRTLGYTRGRPSKIAVASRARLLGPQDEPLPVTIVKTRNYDEFIIPTGVPEPTEEEVTLLMDRIDYCNELQWNPIRVTPYLEVYDGKKRLEAARRLGLELCYVVDERLSVGDIILYRGDPRGWEYDQYCLYYAEQGRSQYEELLAFAKEHQLPLGSAMSLLNWGGTQAKEEVALDFKCGRFRITSREHAMQVISLRDQHRARIPKAVAASKKDMTEQRVFLNAVSNHLGKPGVDEQALSGILEQIRWQPTESDYERHMRRLLKEAAVLAS
jgi:hypothetical protein